MTDYTIADLYAAQSYLQSILSSPISMSMMSDTEFRTAQRDLSNVEMELRERVQKMIGDYEL